MSVGLVLAYALAVTRATGLVTLDEITRPARDWFLARLPANRLGVALEYLTTCEWCASIWVGAAAAALMWRWGSQPWLLIPALALAFSQVAGMLSAIGRAPAVKP